MPLPQVDGGFVVDRPKRRSKDMVGRVWNAVMAMPAITRFNEAGNGNQHAFERPSRKPAMRAYQE